MDLGGAGGAGVRSPGRLAGICPGAPSPLRQRRGGARPLWQPRM